jgi:BlaI family transcriptional regulator, penicillinase repressor
MNVVWERSPISGADVAATLADDNKWHPKTVLTFLARLEGKGVLEVQREGRPQLYSPLLTREQCVLEEGDSFLQRVFRGATAPLLTHFVERAELTDDEIEDLQRLLNNRRSSPK